jgi:nitrate/TMAO reductase-like tetraheme cytochrome c subunit
MSSLNPLEKEVLKYQKKGFEKEQQMTLKFGIRVLLKKPKKALITWAYKHVYMYYVDGNASVENIHEGLKDYLKYYKGEELEETKGFLIIKGNDDEKLFKTLRAEIIKKEDVRKNLKFILIDEPRKKLSEMKQKKEKDTRRTFTKTQKNEILAQQDNKCAECQQKLDPRATEFDHKKPWASGGRTIVVNGRALCANCHKIASHKHRLKQVDR